MSAAPWARNRSHARASMGRPTTGTGTWASCPCRAGGGGPGLRRRRRRGGGSCSAQFPHDRREAARGIERVDRGVGPEIEVEAPGRDERDEEDVGGVVDHE